MEPKTKTKNYKNQKPIEKPKPRIKNQKREPNCEQKTKKTGAKN